MEHTLADQLQQHHLATIKRDFVLAKTKLKAYVSNLLLWYRQDDGYADIYVRRLPTEALKAVYHETLAITNCNDIKEELDWLITLSEFLELISRKLSIVEKLLQVKCTERITYIACTIFMQTRDNDISEKYKCILLNILHYLQKIYDPHQLWKHFLFGSAINNSQANIRAELMDGHLLRLIKISFTEESINNQFDYAIYLELVQLYGCIICGSRENANNLIAGDFSLVLFTLLKLTIDKRLKINGQDSSQYSDVDDELRSTSLKCLIKTCHVASNTAAKAKIDIIVGSFLQLFEISNAFDHWSVTFDLRMKLLDAIPDFMDNRNWLELKEAFLKNECYKQLFQLLSQCSEATPSQVMEQLVVVTKCISSILKGDRKSKQSFLQMKGYEILLTYFRETEASRELVDEVLYMIGEDRFDEGNAIIKNAEAILLLLNWVPYMPHEIQLYVVVALENMFKQSFYNRSCGCRIGLVNFFINELKNYQNNSHFHVDVIITFIRILEVLGRHSIAAPDLKSLLNLLYSKTEIYNEPRFRCQIIQAIYGMISKSSRDEVNEYFDLQHTDSRILVTPIMKWPGSGFTFQAWVRLDMHNFVPIKYYNPFLYRRHLYSFLTSDGHGFEAFFTAEASLVVAVCTKKNYQTVSVSENPLSLRKWHHICVVHSSRKPFGQGHVSVYIDGKLRHNGSLKFPSISEPFAFSSIGGGFVTRNGKVQVPKSAAAYQIEMEKIEQSGRVTQLHLQQMQNHQSEGVVIAGQQERVWGFPIALQGQISNICLFHESLSSGDVITLYSRGANCLSLFQPRINEDEKSHSILTDLSNKLVFYYSAKAVVGTTCSNLAPAHTNRSNLTGSVFGEIYVRYDAKDSINNIGDFRVLFLLLELYRDMPIPSIQTSNNTLANSEGTPQLDIINSPTSASDTVENSKTPEFTKQSTLQSPHTTASSGTFPVSVLDSPHKNSDTDQWLLVSQNLSSLNSGKEDNDLATFFKMLLWCLKHSALNIDIFTKYHCIPIMAALMKELNPWFLDATVITAIRLLVEFISYDCPTLLPSIYDFWLFDFQLWSSMSFDVRIGHIQYISTIIKENRTHYRREYGVKFLLDIILTHYSANTSFKLSTIIKDPVSISKKETRIIRSSLLGLIKFYISDEITEQELEAIMKYMAIATSQVEIADILDVLINLISNVSTASSVYRLLGRSENLATILSLLTNDLKDAVARKIFKIIASLLASEQLSEAQKHKLRLGHVGFEGFAWHLSFLQLSPYIAKMTWRFAEVIEQSEVGEVNLITCMLLMVQSSSLVVRLIICKKILSKLTSNVGHSYVCSQQPGWQDCFIRLLATKNGTKQSMDRRKTSVALAHQQSSSMDNGDDNNDSIIDKNEKEFQLSSATCKEIIKSIPQSTTNDAMRTASEKHDEDVPSGSRQDNTVNASKLSTMTSTDSEDIEKISSISTQFDKSKFTNQSSSIDAFESDQSQRKASIAYDILSDDDENIRRDLLTTVVESLFNVLWYGINGTTEESWIERSQIFVAIDSYSALDQLIVSPCVIKGRLLQKILSVIIKSINHANEISYEQLQNATYTIRIIDFLLSSKDADLDPVETFDIKTLELTVKLFDLLGVWGYGPSDPGWMDMIPLSFKILMSFISRPQLRVCASSVSRFHHVVELYAFQRQQEICYVLAGIYKALVDSLVASDNNNFSVLVPLIRSILNKYHEQLCLKDHVPSLPNVQNSQTFFENFLLYMKTEEWNSFMHKKINPLAQQYIKETFNINDAINEKFWFDCRKANINSVTNLDEKIVSPSRKQFESDVLKLYIERRYLEKDRILNRILDQKKQHSRRMCQWNLTKKLFLGERGILGSKITSTPVWKLCSTENYSRMRLKLLPQYNADTHIKASQLRDNTGTNKDSVSTAVSMLANIPKKVSAIDSKEDDEEDLSSLMNNNSIDTLEQKGEEKLILAESCELVIMMDEIPGYFKLTTNRICFTDLRSEISDGLPYDFEISLLELREVHLRRYNLNRSAIEIFLIDQNNYFFNFTKETRNKVYSQIMMLNHPNLYYAGIRSAADLLKASKLTKKWTRREMSNFDYLMQLNMIAGRTYNDLNQYPVFPWVLRDYTSNVLDLDDPLSYRDFSKPIGIQNPDRMREIQERYETFEDPTGTISKFHYGTHYSNAAGVMHYLLRLEPFATLHIQLQSGRFDCADRQFHSLPMTWKMLLESHGDVKELIPEFFYLPDFLRNISKFDLGKLQSGERVDDVILPPWANSAEDFIRKHRTALESEYVSAHLHEWIDLIFGFKQKGRAAVDALNVFYYCTYEGAVDIDTISDITHREATIGMIKNFGQTPTQLLKEPHPRRMTQEEATNYARKQSTLGQYIPAIHLFNNLSKAKTHFIDASAGLGKLVYIGIPSIQTRSFIHSGMLDSLITLTDTAFFGVHGWLPYSKSKSMPFTFELDGNMTSRNIKSRKNLNWPFAPDIEVLPKLFNISNDAKLLFSGGYWDNSLRIYNINKGRLQNSISIFNDLVTCMSIDRTGRYLIVGSRDSSTALWEINQSDGINVNPARHYYGHDDEVTCVGINSELDVIVSGSKDGSCIMYMIRNGTYVMSLWPTTNIENLHQCEVIALTISELGNITLFCRHFEDQMKTGEYFIHLYSINGRLLARKRVDKKINDMIMAKHHIITGDIGGTVTIRNDYDLNEEMSFQLSVPIRCVSISSNNEHILVGLDDGKLIIISCNVKDN